MHADVNSNHLLRNPPPHSTSSFVPHEYFICFWYDLLLFDYCDEKKVHYILYDVSELTTVTTLSGLYVDTADSSCKFWNVSYLRECKSVDYIVCVCACERNILCRVGGGGFSLSLLAANFIVCIFHFNGYFSPFFFMLLPPRAWQQSRTIEMKLKLAFTIYFILLFFYFLLWRINALILFCKSVLQLVNPKDCKPHHRADVANAATHHHQANLLSLD